MNALSGAVIGAAIEVHRELGVGLLESAYCLALAAELTARGLPFESQVMLRATYKGLDVGDSYRLDFLIAETIIVEVKAVSMVLPIHRAQLLTYLRLSGKPLGLLINFHAPYMNQGISRIANGRL